MSAIVSADDRNKGGQAAGTQGVAYWTVTENVQAPDRTKPTKAFVILGIFAGVWLLLAIPLVTDAGIGLEAVILAGFGLELSVAWAVTGLVFLSRKRTWSSIAWFLSTPFAGLVAICLASHDIGLTMRIALSESSLKQHVAQAPPGICRQISGKMVGLFLVSEEIECEGTIVLFTASSGLMNRAGLAYIPEGKRMPPGEYRYRNIRRVYKNWYRFEEKF
jgi:hypothetical protein